MKIDLSQISHCITFQLFSKIPDGPAKLTRSKTIKTWLFISKLLDKMPKPSIENICKVFKKSVKKNGNEMKYQPWEKLNLLENGFSQLRKFRRTSVLLHLPNISNCFNNRKFFTLHTY